MRYIPEYYTDKDYPEFQALSKNDQDKILEGIEAYKNDVIKAIELAKEKHIQPLLDETRLVIYCKTWGK